MEAKPEVESAGPEIEMLDRPRKHPPVRLILHALRVFRLWRRDNECAVELRKDIEAFKAMNLCITKHCRWAPLKESRGHL